MTIENGPYFADFRFRQSLLNQEMDQRRSAVLTGHLAEGLQQMRTGFFAGHDRHKDCRRSASPFEQIPFDHSHQPCLHRLNHRATVFIGEPSVHLRECLCSVFPQDFENIVFSP